MAGLVAPWINSDAILDFGKNRFGAYMLPEPLFGKTCSYVHWKWGISAFITERKFAKLTKITSCYEILLVNARVTLTLASLQQFL